MSDDGMSTIRVPKPEAVRAALAEERREIRDRAWIEGYEACKIGKQMHSPYAKERQQ